MILLHDRAAFHLPAISRRKRGLLAPDNPPLCSPTHGSAPGVTALLMRSTWEKEFKAMEQHLSRIGQADFRLYQETKKWYVDVGDMLAYVKDVLSPHGFDDIVKDDFASLRQMLQQRR